MTPLFGSSISPPFSVLELVLSSAQLNTVFISFFGLYHIVSSWILIAARVPEATFDTKMSSDRHT